MLTLRAIATLLGTTILELCKDPEQPRTSVLECLLLYGLEYMHPNQRKLVYFYPWLLFR